MMAGVRNLKTGECTLLATGVIAAHEGGTAGEAARIGPDTTRVIFKLTALTAEIKDAPGSAFRITPVANYGIITIGDQQHPFFEIQAGSSGVPATTDAELALSGWGDGAEENDTKQFIYLVNDKAQTFGLAGIGTNTNEGDAPLPSTANITWSITNDEGLLDPADQIKIQFTSKSSAADASGMGWLPVGVAVQAFSKRAGGQVWQAGSGILRNQLDGGAGTEGAGIVILHGNKMSKPGVGAQQDWVWERAYVLDLANANPGAVAGLWEYDAPTTGPNVAGVYRLTGEKTVQVQVINSTDDHRIEVKANAEVAVVLDGMSIDLDTSSNAGSPFELGTGSKVTLYLKDANTLKAYYDSSNQVAGLQTTGAELTIQEGSGSSPGRLTVNGGQRGAGIGGANGGDGGTITIKSGIIGVFGFSAGIGGGGTLNPGADGGAGGTVIIEGGDITAYGHTGIGGGDGYVSGNGGKGADVTIKGGTVKAYGGLSAGIGGGFGYVDGGNGGNFEITGGLVIAESVGGAGIGGGFSLNGAAGAGVGGSDNIKISGGTVIARSFGDGGAGGAGIGGGYSPNGTGGKAIADSGAIIISGGVVFAEGADGSNDGAGIGNGRGGSAVVSGGTITISGGTVYARGGPNAEGIGRAEGGGSVPGGTSATITKTGAPVIFASSINGITQDTANAILITDVTITPISGSGTGGSGFDTATYTGFHGYTLAVTANSSFTVPAAATFSIPGVPSGSMTFALGSGPYTLTNNGEIVNRGTITINSGNTLNTTVGTVDNTGGTLTLNTGTLTGASSVSGGTIN